MELSVAETRDEKIDLQLWQYCVELYQKMQQDRRELSLPGITKVSAANGNEQLFTEDDVKLHRSQQNISNLGKKGVRSK